MRYVLERVVEPEIEPVTLADFFQLKGTDAASARDSEISDLIIGARQWAEHYTGRALIDQTWRLTILSRFGAHGGGDTVYGHRGPGPVNYGYYCGSWNWLRSGEIALRRAPVLAVTRFATVDSAGAETVIDASTYELREAASRRPRIVALDGATWSAWSTSDLRITYRAGYADRLGSPQQDASLVPVQFKQAIKLWVQANYDRGDDMQRLLTVAEQLIEDLCIDSGFA